MVPKRILSVLTTLAALIFFACTQSPYNRGMGNWGHMMGYGGGFMWLIVLVLVGVVIYFLFQVSNSGLPDNDINGPGEIRQLTPADIYERRRTLKDPNSGREQKFIFIPQRLADRLKDYVRQKDIQSHERIFPVCYAVAREMVVKAGGVVYIHLRPHVS